MELASPQLQNDGSVTFGSDNRLYVQFYARSVHNPVKSQAEGSPIFESRDYVKIQQPGERDVFDSPVTEEHKMRFANQWRAYQEKLEQTPTGTPLAVMFAVEPHMVDMMRAKKIYTVEQLAGLTEHGISGIGMGGRAHVERAKRFLESAAGTVQQHQFEKELSQRDDKIAALENQIQHLTEALNKRPTDKRTAA